MRYALLLLIITLTFNSFGQDNDIIYARPEVDSPALYAPGDTNWDAFYYFIEEEVRFPMKAFLRGLGGEIICSFVVEKDGSLSDRKIIESTAASPMLENEALRLLNSLHDHWIPARKDGKPVRIRYDFPVVFDGTMLVRNNYNEIELDTALGFIEEGDIDGAIDMLTRLYRGDPQNPEIYFRRGLLYLEQDKPRLACKDFRAAAEYGHPEAGKLLQKYCQ